MPAHTVSLGGWKYWSERGVLGVLVFYFLIWELPAGREHEIVKEATQNEREEKRFTEYRQERREGLRHAESTVGSLIKESQESNKRLTTLGVRLEDLTKTMDRHQTQIRINQERIIEATDAKLTKSTALGARNDD